MIGVPIAQAAGLITAMRIAGPSKALLFVAKTVWLLVASLGEKARAKAASPHSVPNSLERMRAANI